MAQNERLIYKKAMEWVIEAGEMVRERLNDGLAVEYKSHISDPVTQVDREIETFLINHIRNCYPLHSVLGEESIANVSASSPYLWIIDPIDGTTNFINQKRDFAISVALCKQDQIVFGFIYDVISDDLYHVFAGEGAYRNHIKLPPFRDEPLDHALVAVSPHWRSEDEVKEWGAIFHLAPYVRGLRSYGSTSIELGLLALGRLEGYVSHHVYPWDYAAGRLLIEELGGRVTDLQGNPIPLTHEGGVVAGTRVVHIQIIERLSMLFKFSDK